MSLPDLDWSTDFERGYEAALLGLLNHFEDEHNKSASEDPYYAHYAKYVVSVIRKALNPLVKHDE